jgi:CRISPR-associated Cas5-like protein
VEAQVCLGLRLHVPFWCSFRDPASSNVHRTFPVPPPSTLYGLIAAALGMPQDDYSRRDGMRFAIAIERGGDAVETYSKWMKGAEASPKDNNQRLAWDAMRKRGILAPDESIWISTPLIRQKIIQPVYAVGILCAAETAGEISRALARPFFPLYLGESDDPVDIEILGVDTPSPSMAPATGAVSGVRPGGILASLPTRFSSARRGTWTLERWLVTVPAPKSPIASPSDAVSCHGHVWNFEPPCH